MMERGVIRELTDNGYGHAASGFLLKMQILVMLVLTNGRGGWERELQSGMPHAPQQSIPGWQFWRRRG